MRSLEALLSPAELTRASRFGRPSLRNRFIIGRGTLRRLLGKTLDVEPFQVEIERGARGRPFVPVSNGLDFNISHTDDVALFAFTRDQRIGVDVEREDRQLNVEGVARRFMSVQERDALRLLDEQSRRIALLRLWTCKEAMSKATGDALSAPFRDMSVVATDTLRLVAGPHPYEPAQWQLAPVAGPTGYLATVALWRGR